MRMRPRDVILTACPVALIAAATLPATAQDESAASPRPVDQLRAEAEALTPLVESELARGFLAATADLPTIEQARVVYWNGAERRALRPHRAESMSGEELEGFRKLTLDETFYYYTFFGTPLAYARALDLAAGAGFETAEGKRVLDFGFGGIGHLRLLASLGAHVTGVEVLELLRDFYREPDDIGLITRSGAAPTGSPGFLYLLYGRFPAEPAIVGAVGEGYDLFVSKNVLKKGYVHPEREVDPRNLVDLGVDDETYVRAVFGILNRGGLFVIYNLYPPQNPPDQPYIPHATGGCPFERKLIEDAGFEVVAFDVDDTDAARAMGHALGWADGMDLENGLFAMYTILRRP